MRTGDYFLRVSHTDPCGVGEFKIEVSFAGDDATDPFTRDIDDFKINQKVTKLALVVGIDRYENSIFNPTLAGCENDARDMENLLRQEFEFPERNVEILLSGQARRRNIIRGFQRLIARAARAKSEGADKVIVVFHYSGHGGQMKDVAPYKDEGDDIDETIIPYDSGSEGVFDISDDEIYLLTSELAKHSKNVTFILDSCHSGDAHKGTGLARRAEGVRATPPRPLFDVANAPSLPASGVIKEDLRDARFYTFIAGSDEELLSYELDSEEGGGKPRGALTYYLTRAIRRGIRRSQTSLTYRQVMDAVKSDVTGRYSSQRPHLIGTNVDKVVFGDTTVVARPYAIAQLDETRLKLKAGAAHGMTVGSTFGLYPIDGELGDLRDKTKSIAKIVLTSVDAFEATAEIPAALASAARSTNYRAVERQHVFEKELIPIVVETPRTPTLTRIGDLLANSKEFSGYFEIRAAGDARLVVGERDGKIEITRGGESEPFTAIAVDDEQLLAQVGETVRDWTRWHRVQELDNPGSDLKIVFKLEPPDGQTPEAASDHLALTLFNDTTVKAEIKNTSGRKLFFYFLNIDGQGDVKDLQNGGQKPLNDQASMSGVTFTFRIPMADGKPKFSRYRETIKIIASEEKINLGPLLVAGAKAAVANPLEQLLARGGLNSKAEMTVKSGGWVTVSQEVETVLRD